jgi:hypothetical protein
MGSAITVKMRKESQMTYRGWSIYWTGWKKDWTEAPFHKYDDQICTICHQAVDTGVRVEMNFMTDMLTHWTCRYPDNRPGYLWSQWVAVRHPGWKSEKCIYTTCCPLPSEQAPGGRFQRGECFEIPEGFVHVTEFTSEHSKEYSKRNGLERLFHLLDQEADGELENPVRMCFCKQCGGNED